MGEAKRRGTLEQRIAQAQARKKAEEQVRKAKHAAEHRPPTPEEIEKEARSCRMLESMLPLIGVPFIPKTSKEVKHE